MGHQTTNRPSPVPVVLTAKSFESGNKEEKCKVLEEQGPESLLDQVGLLEPPT